MWWTLAASALASSTALVIAFVAYPWQKRKDRELKLSEERREACRQFIALVISEKDHLFELDRSADDQTPEDIWTSVLRFQTNVSAELAKLALIADENLLRSGSAFVDALLEAIKREEVLVDQAEEVGASAHDVYRLLRKATAEIANERLPQLYRDMREYGGF
jgi:DNA-binding phage protein